MEQLVRSSPPEAESAGFLPASDIDTGVIPIRASGRGMLQVAVDETRRTAALKAPVKARVEALDFYYGELKALKNLTMDIREKQVTALIGPSGCGKTTFLRCFNRMHDLTPGTRYEGRIMLLPEEINLVARGCPAAGAVHSACPRHQPGDAAVRRADLGAGFDRHGAHRGTDRFAARAGHGPDRHAQYAAGGASVGLHGVPVSGRSDRIR